MTVMRTYAGKVMDAFLDVYGLAYGRVTDAHEWEAKLRERERERISLVLSASIGL